MKGRKPAPIEEKLAKGETRPSRVNYQQPELPPPDSLEPPRDLRGAGLKIWKEQAQALRDAGHLRAPHLPVFLEYCRIASEIEKTRKRKDDSGLRLLANLRNQLLRYAAECGVTVVSSTKVRTVTKPPVEKPKHERFFGGGIRGVVRGGRAT